MRFCLVAILALLTNAVIAQQFGDLDTTFGGPVINPINTSRFDFSPKSVAIQADGKLIVGGRFNTYNGDTARKIIRLLPNGDIDTTFKTGRGIEGFGADTYVVNAVAVDSVGKIYVVGLFDYYNSIACKNIIRLNIDGSIDTTFHFGVGLSSEGNCIAVQADNKVIIGGDFYGYNGHTSRNIIRINVDGSADNTLVTGSGFNDEVLCLALQTDGKILVGGSFSLYKAGARFRFARLSPNGNLDNIPGGTSFNNDVRAIVCRPDGKIVVAGDFTTYNNVARNYLICIQPNGALDTTFNVGSGFDDYTHKLLALPDNNVVVSGEFTTYKGLRTGVVVKLSPTGQVQDWILNNYPSERNVSACMALQADGDIILAGDIQDVDQFMHKGIARIKPSGWIDSAFVLKYRGASNDVNKFAQQEDGRILVQGYFSYYNSHYNASITRVHANGDLDTSFRSYFIGANDFRSFAYDSVSKKIYIGGSLSAYNGMAVTHLFRLNLNGTLDTGFYCAAVGTGSPAKIIIQQDGKLLLLGVSGSPGNLMRVNADGSLDTSFHANIILPVNDAIIQPDGKIVTAYTSQQLVRGLRLNSNGSIDSSFTLIEGVGENTGVRELVLAPNGKVLIRYSRYPSISTIRRYNNNGTRDSTFNEIVTNDVNVMALTNDGNLLVGGSRSNNIDTACIKLFTPNGIFDHIVAGFTTYSEVMTLYVMPDNKVLVGGGFRKYRTYTIPAALRLHNTCTLPAQPISITGNSTYCTNLAQQLYTTAPVSNASMYNWTVPAGWNVAANGEMLQVNPSPNAQSGVIQVSAQNGCGASQAYTMQVDIGTSPLQPTAIYGLTALCQNAGAVTFNTATVSNATNYIWTYPAGWLATQSQDSLYAIVSDSAQSGSITIIAANGCGQSPAQMLQVTVDSSIIPIANITVEDSTVCSGNIFNFTANVNGEGNAPGYFWMVNNDTVNNLNTSLSIDSLQNGDVVQFSLSSSSQCAITPTALSNIITVTIHALPNTPSVTVNSDTLVSSSTNGNQWYNADGTIVSGETSQTFEPNITGNYYTIVTDSNGCTSPPSDTVAFIISGINQFKAGVEFSIYPNPSQNTVHIATDIDGTYNIRLFNTKGALLSTQPVNGRISSINVEELANGVYYVEVQDANNNVARKRMVKM